MCKLWSAKSDAPSHSFSLFTAQVARQIGQVVSRAQSMRIGINSESTIDLRNMRSTIVTIYNIHICVYIYIFCTPSQQKTVKRSWFLDIGNSYVGSVQHVPLFLLEIPLIFFVTSFAPQNVQSSAMYPETRHGCESQAAPLKGQGLFQEQKTVTLW